MARALILSALAVWCVGTAQAQDYAPTLKPSPAALCMTLAAGERGQPEYPQVLLDRKDGGTVKVELVFAAPDRAPVVRVLDENVNPLLTQSALDHVRHLRVPCMGAGDEPARLVQTYVFSPNDGRTVMATTPRDVNHAQRELRKRCLQRILPGVRPEYPDSARRLEEQGKYMVSLRFVSATAQPEVTFLDADRNNHLRWSVETFAKGYRMPCMGAEPVEMTMLFDFQMDGGARTRLRDTTLRDFLAGVARATVQTPVFFDLDTMRCPFDVRLTYGRPHGANAVDQLENGDAARQPLLDWLSQMTLKLPPATNRKVLGETMTITIPCGTVNLQPSSAPPSPSSSTSSKEKS